MHSDTPHFDRLMSKLCDTLSLVCEILKDVSAFLEMLKSPDKPDDKQLPLPFEEPPSNATEE